MDTERTMSTVCTDTAGLMTGRASGLYKPALLYSVSTNVSRLVCYNYDTCEWILTFFGRNITDKVANQMTLYYAYASALPAKMAKHENCICSLKRQNSTRRCLIFSIFLTHDSYSRCCMTP